MFDTRTHILTYKGSGRYKYVLDTSYRMKVIIIKSFHSLPKVQLSVTGRVNCTYCTPGFGPQSSHTITLLLSRALAVARA